MADYSFYDNKFVPNGAVGLTNSGNICWWNSVIQALLSCSQLNQYMLAHGDHFNNNIVAQNYIELIRAALIDDQPNLSAASQKLLSAVVASKNMSKAIQLQIGAQNDAIEGIMALFNLLGDKDLEKMFFHRVMASSICLLCKRVSYENKTEAPNIPYFIHLSELSKGDFTNALLCNWSVNNGMLCEKCGEQSNKGLIVYKLVMAREILVIAIENTNEAYGQFNYPYLEHLALPTFEDQELKYRHVATINHYGGRYWTGTTSHSSGHYTATCHRRDGSYWNTDDSGTLKAPDFKTSPNAYILFYCLEKIE